MKGFKSSILGFEGIFHIFGTKHVTTEEHLREIISLHKSYVILGGAKDPRTNPLTVDSSVVSLPQNDRSDFYIPNTRQVHGSDVHVIDETWGGTLQYGDGWVTNRTGVACFVYTADCVPVLLCDPVNRVVGAVHCGWRSMAAGIAENAVDKMCGLGADKKNIHVVIGPSICADCYEVGGELRETFAIADVDVDRHFKSLRQNKYLMHLTGICRELYINSGLSADNIEDLEVCTRCKPDLFVSYRREQGTDDRQVSLIALF